MDPDEKAKAAERRTRYLAVHSPEQIKAQRRAHYLANREKVLAQTKAYRTANQEKMPGLPGSLSRGASGKATGLHGGFNAARRAAGKQPQ